MSGRESVIAMSGLPREVTDTPPRGATLSRDEPRDGAEVLRYVTSQVASCGVMTVRMATNNYSSIRSRAGSTGVQAARASIMQF